MKSKLLTIKQLDAISTIINEPTITEGIEKAGISRSTYYRLRKKPEFRSEYDRLIEERYERARADFLNLDSKAHRAFSESLESQNEVVKLSAAKSYYAQITRWKELSYRDKVLEAQNKGAAQNTGNVPPWNFISSVVDGATLPDPFMYARIRKLPPQTWKQIVTMELPEDSWELILESAGEDDRFTIYSAALKCLLDAMSFSDPDVDKIFKKLRRQTDDFDDAALVCETWDDLMDRIASFELTEPTAEEPSPATEKSERRFRYLKR